MFNPTEAVLDLLDAAFRIEYELDGPVEPREAIQRSLSQFAAMDPADLRLVVQDLGDIVLDLARVLHGRGMDHQSIRTLIRNGTVGRGWTLPMPGPTTTIQ